MTLITKELKRLMNASRYSWQGLKSAVASEAAIRLEILVMIILIPVALLLPRTPLEKTLLIVSLLWLFTVELLNSAIEAVVDRIGLEHHHLSGKAKDIGSTAVLIACISTLLVWLCILFWS